MSAACRVEKAERAAAQQIGEVRGRWKARLSEAEAAHVERACALQHDMRQRLEQAQSAAEEGVASARRWGLSHRQLDLILKESLLSEPSAHAHHDEKVKEASPACAAAQEAAEDHQQIHEICW